MKKKAAGINGEMRRKARRRAQLVKWSAIVAALALVVFGISQMSSILYDEDDIRAVNFSSLSDKQKTTALEAANSARCPCGCGMNLAQCVATDMTCPIRETNVERIKGMVREAQAGPES
jgi:hypothetical protein